MSTAKPPFDVEPLSEARWERIERGIFERLDGAAPSVPQPERAAPWTSARLLVVAGMAAAAAVLVTTFSAHRTTPISPSHIETGSDRSRVALGEASLEVGPHSGVVVTGNDAQGVLLVLERGEIDCEVPPREGRPPFVVQSGGVRVRVVGTRFHVGRREGGSEVSVSHGTVQVTAGDKIVDVHAGERWDSSTPAALGMPSIGATAADGISSERTRPPNLPSPEHASSKPARTTTQTSADAPHPEIAGSAPGATDERPTSSAREPSSREAYEAAARLEASDPSAALTRYRELSHGGDAWAANALYAEGRLAFERGDRTRAERALREYLARFPAGLNARDARELLGAIDAKRR